MPDVARSDPVAFLGLGRMGTPMAARLVAGGRRVVAYDPSEAARARAVGRGCELAASAVDALAGADVVVTILPDERAVTTLARDDGLLAHWRPGVLWIEMTSSLPSVTRALAAAVLGAGGLFVDAPVSGGVAGAEAGTLTVMAAGGPAALERARPLLELLAGRIVHVGTEAGAGDAVKSLNNMLSAVNLTAATEALTIALREGIDPRVLVDVVRTSTGASNAVAVKLPEFVLAGRETGFTIDQYLKDLRIALTLAAEGGYEPELAARTRAVWQALADADGGGRDHVDVVRLLVEREGLSLPAT
jgi:3-hydroxyisobutyrate dehydrogenase